MSKKVNLTAAEEILIRGEMIEFILNFECDMQQLTDAAFESLSLRLSYTPTIELIREYGECRADEAYVNARCRLLG